MKKALSLILAAALMSVGFAAIGSSVSADEPDAALEIDTVEKWNEFAGNAREYDQKLVKVTADLDFTGKEFKPVPEMVCVIDGGGKTISGINLTYDDAGTGLYGILINDVSNSFFNGVLKNVVVKDSSITVNLKADANPDDTGVGLVGRLNRGHATDITLENVTIKVSGNANVGAIAGIKRWATGGDNANAGFEAVGDNAAMKNIKISKTTIDAPDAEKVGVIVGSCWDGAKATLEGASASAKVVSKNGATAETLAGDASADFATGTGNDVKVGDDLGATVASTGDPTTGDPTTGDPTTGDTTGDPTTGGEANTDNGNSGNSGNTGNPKTGSASLVMAGIAVVALAGALVASKKREQD